MADIRLIRCLVCDDAAALLAGDDDGGLNWGNAHTAETGHDHWEGHSFPEVNIEITVDQYTQLWELFRADRIGMVRR